MEYSQEEEQLSWDEWMIGKLVPNPHTHREREREEEEINREREILIGRTQASTWTPSLFVALNGSNLSHSSYIYINK